MRNTIRSWALIAVGISSAFTIGISVWLIAILSAQDWCARALGASKYANGRPETAIQACFELMNEQVGTLGWALLIVIGVQGLSLLVLVVIVLAGGKLSFTAGKSGVSADIERISGAKEVAEAAEERAAEIEGEVK